jgi:hypothetical protein
MKLDSIAISRDHGPWIDRRAVVNHDYLNALSRLTQSGLDRLIEVLHTVEYGDNDRDAAADASSISGWFCLLVIKPACRSAYQKSCSLKTAKVAVKQWGRNRSTTPPYRRNSRLTPSTLGGSFPYFIADATTKHMAIVCLL